MFEYPQYFDDFPYWLLASTNSVAASFSLCNIHFSSSKRKWPMNIFRDVL